jgi:hypothetical protein
MIAQHLAILCAMLLIWTSCCAATSAQGASTSKPSVQEQVAGLPTGAAVVVKTVDKRTLTGRLGALNERGFELQYAKDSALTSETLAFTDVKSVKVKGHGLSTGAKIAIGAAIGVAAVVGVLAILFAVYED